MHTFTLSLLLLLGSPGPGVLSLAGVGSAFGYRAGWNYGFGLFIGSNAVMAVAATGLAALFQADERFRLVFTALSAIYLIWLTAKIAMAGSRIAFLQADRPPGFWGGIALQVINPKAYAVGTFVFSNFPFWPSSIAVEILLKFLILNLVWIPIHIAWLIAGVAINELNLASTTQRTINMLMAAAMLVVVGLAIWSTIYGGGADLTALATG